MLRDLAGRLTHVVVIALGCCVGVMFLAMFLTAEIMEVCRPSWGK